MNIRQALTFDDVSIEPAASQVMPGQANLRSRLTARIDLGIPILSAAMDTVTEAPLAIAIAQALGWYPHEPRCTICERQSTTDP